MGPKIHWKCNVQGFLNSGSLIMYLYSQCKSGGTPSMSMTDQILDGIYIHLRWWKMPLTICHYLVALCRVSHTVFCNLIESQWCGLAGGIWKPDWSRLWEPSEEQVCQQTSEAVPCSRGAELRRQVNESDSSYQHTCLYKAHVLCFQGKAVLFVCFRKLSHCNYSSYLDW